MPRNIVRGQTVDPERIRRARELRKNQTPEEKILWQELRGGRPGVHFRRQQIIAGYIADFYCHSAAVLVELDGSGHLLTARLRPPPRAGFRQARNPDAQVTNQELRNDPRAVVDKIRAALT